MTETNPTHPALAASTVRLQSLELVARHWSHQLTTEQVLEAAKTYAAWIEHGDSSTPADATRETPDTERN